MTHKKIISVHLPKTAGSSFKQILKDHYGGSIYFDYGDLPINTPPLLRKMRAILDSFSKSKKIVKNFKCIHGHFMSYKYSRLDRDKTTFVTWLRDPLERMISHYHFWLRTYTPQSPHLHKKIVEEKWSLEKFCFSKQMKNFYSQFLWRTPLETFSFVGRTEHFAEDLEEFCIKFLKHKPKRSPRINVGPTKNMYDLSSNFINNFKKHHSKDYYLYNLNLKYYNSK